MTFTRLVWLYCLGLVFGLIPVANAANPGHPLVTTRFKFYSQSLHISYDLSMRDLGDIPEKTQDLLTVYGLLERTQYTYCLQQLQHMKKELKLNDWLYYELLVRASESVFPQEMKQNRVYFQWFMLRKSGYDAQMYYVQDSVYLHVLTTGEQFGFYTIVREGKKYINITAKSRGTQMELRSAVIPKTPEDGASRPFSMDITSLPELDESPKVHKEITFSHRSKDYRLTAILNRDHVQMMDEYPFSNQKLYFQVGLSKAASASLLPALRREMVGMDEAEQLEFLLSFTRTGFVYKEDKESFGAEKPMTAEQTLFYTWSDCEDRTALFFILVRELMDLPVIVLDFETHVGAAVALDNPESGEFFEVEGRKYVYCEPTGPQNTLAVGEMWDDIRQQKARIMMEYNPQ